MKALVSGLFAASLMATSTISAQTPVTHQGLDADFYAADGDTAVLLLHGTLAHNRMEIIETVATLVSEDYGYPVLAPNLSYQLPGREGMLDCGITHTHKDSDAKAEVSKWVQYLTDQGYSKIVVSAHSRGGAQLSAYLADNTPEEVTAAVLIAPATYDSTQTASSYASRFNGDLPALLSKAESLSADTVMAVPGFVYCDNANVAAASFVDYYETREERDTVYNLKSIDIPVWVVAGSEDDVVADLPAKLEAEGVLSDQVQLVMLDGADHFFRDLYADDVALTIVDAVEM